MKLDLARYLIADSTPIRLPYSYDGVLWYQVFCQSYYYAWDKEMLPDLLYQIFYDIDSGIAVIYETEAWFGEEPQYTKIKQSDVSDLIGMLGLDPKNDAKKPAYIME